MAFDFKPRHTGNRQITDCLRADDETASLMREYALARRAGAAVAPLLRPFRLAIDFSDPAYCRVEGNTLVLLVTNAVQQNRLRQLTPRMTAALALQGLPLTAVSVRIMPPPKPQSLLLDEAQGAPRGRTAQGAAAIDSILGDIQDDKLRATLQRMRNILRPDDEARRRSLEDSLGRESLALAQEHRTLCTRQSDLEHACAAAAIPTEAECAEFPRLEAERARKLAENAERQAQIALNARHLSRIEARLTLIGQALEALPHNLDAAEHLAVTEPPAAEQNTPPEPHSPSPAGAAAVEALARETLSPGLRKTLMRLKSVLEPEEAAYTRALEEDIAHEIARLRASEEMPQTPESYAQKQQRLAELITVREALKADPGYAHEAARRLYGNLQ